MGHPPELILHQRREASAPRASRARRAPSGAPALAQRAFVADLATLLSKRSVQIGPTDQEGPPHPRDAAGGGVWLGFPPPGMSPSVAGAWLVTTLAVRRCFGSWTVHQFFA